MITTSQDIIIDKKLRHGVVTSYSPLTVSLFIKHEGVQKRFSPSSVVNSTLTSSGSLLFENIPLWGDGSYSFYITGENQNDLDTSGVELKKIATGYIKKITNSNLLVV